MTPSNSRVAEALNGSAVAQLPGTAPKRQGMSQWATERNGGPVHRKPNDGSAVSKDEVVPDRQIATETDALPPDLLDQQKEKNWLVGVEGPDGATYYYGRDELTTSLRTRIVEGQSHKNSRVVVYSKSAEGSWNEDSSTLQEFAKNHFGLRVLYEPVWSHAMAGLKWGAIAGIVLKLIDSFLLLAVVDSGLAFLFAIAVAVCIIPRIGWVGVAVIAYAITKYSQVNLFVMGMSAALVGALLGCLPGMAIGGIIGLIRKNSLSRAKDAAAERESIPVYAVLLPLLAGCALIALYISVFIPWATAVLE